jgi:Uncharacterized conserved protein
MKEWIGYKRLATRYGIEAVQPLPIESEIGPSRRRIHHDGVTREIYTAIMRPEDTLAAHLTFAIKHEGIHLEFLSRLFDQVPEAEIAAWMNSERTGQYARRVGFLWEWLKGRELRGVKAVTGGNYVDAIDPDTYLTRTQPENNPRWRVRDNLPGTRHFCPTIRRTKAVIDAEQYDCAKQLDALQAEYGTDILMRSAVWLTVKESRASFQIEREDNRADRIQRFAAVMERRCGEHQNPLDRETLTELQREVIGDKSTFSHFGLRRSPVFVGETSGFQEVVHYVAPHWEELDTMLRGMESFIERTKGTSPIARAAVASFGFVYIHPLADGNGRIHRFLINDILRRDGAVPKPYILPVSATITNKPQNRARYDTVLELFSKPLMARYSGLYAFGPSREYEDKISSNFVFTGYDDALPAWRYLDLTHHVEYLAELIDSTLRLEMREEANLLRRWDNARTAIKEIIEGPNQDIDRIIRAIKGHGGNVSNKLAKEFPVLADAEITAKVTEAVAAAFEMPLQSPKDQDHASPGPS